MNVTARPNPARNVVDFEIDVEAQNVDDRRAEIVLYDVFGHEVYKGKISFNQSNRVNVEGFSKGIYFYKVFRDGHLLYVNKLLIER